jgi:hypothetical protein
MNSDLAARKEAFGKAALKELFHPRWLLWPSLVLLLALFIPISWLTGNDQGIHEFAVKIFPWLAIHERAGSLGVLISTVKACSLALLPPTIIGFVQSFKKIEFAWRELVPELVKPQEHRMIIAVGAAVLWLLVFGGHYFIAEDPGMLAGITTASRFGLAIVEFAVLLCLSLICVAFLTAARGTLL